MIRTSMLEIRRAMNALAILSVLFFVVSLSACSSEPVTGSGPETFVRYCATCHQADGNGIEGAFPPIRGTEWVEGDKGRLIRLVLYGMQGPIEIQGKPYNNVMTPRGFLTDEQVASVLTYVRSNFGNDAEAVRTDEVARVRAAEGERDLFMASRLLYRIGIPEADSTGQ
ncbi:MAG: cytochrome c [Bacteroidota bacterium]|nr:cytochrome c [Bacteroidota bacterium]